MSGWGTAWGASWGDAWGTVDVAAPPPPPPPPPPAPTPVPLIIQPFIPGGVGFQLPSGLGVIKPAHVAHVATISALVATGYLQ